MSTRTRRAPVRRHLAAAAILALAAGASAACEAGGDGATPASQDGATPWVERSTGPDGRTGEPADPDPDPDRAENVIIVVGDGMGVTHRELIRLTTVGPDAQLAMDQLAFQGLSETDPADAEPDVTDSAAAATALATGERTVNGSIALDPDGNVLTTLLERAGRAGKSTGLVTTARVTDATPAAFGAHADDRAEQSEIARQYLEETAVDVILGGGEDRWYPAGSEGRWPDVSVGDESEASKGHAGNLVERAQELGYQYVSDADELAAVREGMLLGLFANEELFEYDDGEEAAYQPAVPLPVMAAKALELLSQDEDGFFVVIEEEGTDGMSHRGNARLLIEAGRALDETVAVARDFAVEHGNTLLVVVADHETGGLTIEQVEEGATADGDENGPFPVAGTNRAIVARWAGGGHTGAPTAVSGEGPGAAAVADVAHHTDVHDLVLEAMQLDQR